MADFSKLSDQVFMSELMSVQSTTLALQNKVDAVRNEDIIRNTALGAVFSKWISNPAMSEQYKEMVTEMTKLEPDEYRMVSENNANNSENGEGGEDGGVSTIGSALQMVQKNQTFYQDVLRNERKNEKGK